MPAIIISILTPSIQWINDRWAWINCCPRGATSPLTLTLGGSCWEQRGPAHNVWKPHTWWEQVKFSFLWAAVKEGWCLVLQQLVDIWCENAMLSSQFVDITMSFVGSSQFPLLSWNCKHFLALFTAFFVCHMVLHFIGILSLLVGFHSLYSRLILSGRWNVYYWWQEDVIKHLSFIPLSTWDKGV